MTEVRDELSHMLARLLARDGFEPHDGLNFNEELEGWDSFKFVELLIEAQERFEVQISARRIEGIETFGALVAAVTDACATRASIP